MLFILVTFVGSSSRRVKYDG